MLNFITTLSGSDRRLDQYIMWTELLLFYGSVLVSRRVNCESHSDEWFTNDFCFPT